MSGERGIPLVLRRLKATPEHKHIMRLLRTYCSYLEYYLPLYTRAQRNYDKLLQELVAKSQETTHIESPTEIPTEFNEDNLWLFYDMNPDATMKDAQEYFGASYYKVTNLLDVLQETGRIERDGRKIITKET